MKPVIPFAVGLMMLSAPAMSQSLDFEGPITRSDAKADVGLLLQKPSTQTQNALTVLKAQVQAQGAMSGISKEQSSVTEGVQQAADWSAANDGKSAAVPDQILIRFSPSASPQDIADVIEEYELDVLDVYVGLGAINAEVDLGERYPRGQTQDEQLAATIAITNEYLQDDRILAASPNIAIGSNASTESAALTPLVPKIVTDMDMETEEHIDWGVDDIKAADLWNEPVLFGPRVGVIDVGFAPHQDLVFDRHYRGPRNDHGNHVAGIICAKHDGKGVAGVVPNCQIVAKTGNFLPVSSESNNVQSFLLLFSQILLSMDEFVTDRDDAVAFNASLGYNWRSNFGIDPSEDDNDLIRANIQNQAVFLFPVLEAARERDLLIFSAAGNDSDSSDPRDAIFASPFNWAARTACETFGNCAGVIVEAHDRNGDRAPFSNVNGDLSCPGVDILSAVSTGPDVYAEMSGTSMASPYCTGGYVLFSMLRPGYDSQQALQCLRDSGTPMPHGTPRMDLHAALEMCPPAT